MVFTSNSAPASNRVSLLAAITLALFFVPIKVGLGGVTLAPSDIASLLSLGFAALVVLEGKAHKLFHPGIGFLLLFTSYVFVNGMLNRVPIFSLITETVQWVAILSLLGVLYAYGVFSDERVMVYFTYCLLIICALVAAWHFAQGYHSGLSFLASVNTLLVFFAPSLFISSTNQSFPCFNAACVCSTAHVARKESTARFLFVSLHRPAFY